MAVINASKPVFQKQAIFMVWWIRRPAEGEYSRGAPDLHHGPRITQSHRFALDKPGSEGHRKGVATDTMKIISQKQRELAMGHLAELLKQDGGTQTQTVQEWLDIAQLRPAQFPSSLPALEVLGLLGFGDVLVQAEKPG
jgi:hypothetical protein